MKSALISLASATLAACAATRAPIVQHFEGATEVSVEYSSRLASAVGLAHRIAGETCADAPADAGIDPAGQAAPGALVQVECKLFEMDRDFAEAMLGAGLCGRRATRAAAESALATFEHARDVKWITSGRLTLLDGRRGTVTVVSPLAFVEAFEVKQAAGHPGLSIGDPVVASVAEGIELEAGTSVVGASSAVRLELTLQSREVLDAEREVTLRLPGCDTSVTLGQPVCYTQVASTSTELGSDEVLVLSGLPTKHERRVLVALVSTRVATPQADGTVAAVPARAQRRAGS